MRITKGEILFGLIVVALAIIVINKDVSVSGNVIKSMPSIKLIAPSDRAQMAGNEAVFVFSYSEESDMSQCSLVIDGRPAEIIDNRLSYQETMIIAELPTGKYIWGISCIDADNQEIVSERRTINMLSQETPLVNALQSLNNARTTYSLELKEDLNLDLRNIVADDIIIMKKGKNIYEMDVLRVIKDYENSMAFAEFMIIPGNKRVKLNEGESAEIDFNNDGAEDIILSLVKISYNKAILNIKALP